MEPRQLGDIFSPIYNKERMEKYFVEEHRIQEVEEAQVNSQASSSLASVEPHIFTCQTHVVMSMNI